MVGEDDDDKVVFDEVFDLLRVVDDDDDEDVERDTVVVEAPVEVTGRRPSISVTTAFGRASPVSALTTQPLIETVWASIVTMKEHDAAFPAASLAV